MNQENMVTPIEEQVANRCIHFTGIQHECCKLGIKYVDIRGEEKPYKFPCMNKSNNCSSAQFLTPEEVEKEVDKIKKFVNEEIIKRKLI